MARGVRASPSLLGGRLLTETPLTSLLFGQLVRLADTLPEMDDPARQVALDATADFAIAALRLETRAAPWDDGADRSGLWLAAERFIARHLDRADLGPDLLARALRCSRTQLYRLFARHDVTVMDHIRETRLARCHEMLTDPACKLPHRGDRRAVRHGQSVRVQPRISEAVQPRPPGRSGDRAVRLRHEPNHAAIRWVPPAGTGSFVPAAPCPGQRKQHRPASGVTADSVAHEPFGGLSWTSRRCSRDR